MGWLTKRLKGGKYRRKLVVVDEQEARQIPDKELAAIVYNNDQSPAPGSRRKALFAHFEYARKELHHTGVNKQILWMEYREQHPDDGYGYSQYCDLFRRWLKDTDPAFHWEYCPGKFTQADYAGKKLFYVDKSTGEIFYCQGFIALPYYLQAGIPFVLPCTPRIPKNPCIPAT